MKYFISIILFFNFSTIIFSEEYSRYPKVQVGYITSVDEKGLLRLDLGSAYIQGIGPGVFVDDNILVVSNQLRGQISRFDKNFKHLETRNLAIGAPQVIPQEKGAAIWFSSGYLILVDNTLNILAQVNKTQVNFNIDTKNTTYLDDYLFIETKDNKIVSFYKPKGVLTSSSVGFRNSEDTLSLFEDGRNEKIKILVENDQLYLFYNGTLRTNNFEKFRLFQKNHSLDLQDNKTYTGVEQKFSNLQTGRLLYLGEDLTGNKYWFNTNDEITIVLGSNGSIVDVIYTALSKIRPKDWIAPILHPSGDLYFLNLESTSELQNIQLLRIVRKW